MDKIKKIYEFSGGFGGPIKRDKLWYFAAGRLSGVHAPIADTFYVPAGSTQADCQAGRVACEQGIDDQYINSATLRFTWQMSTRNKFSIYYEEVDKFRGHGMNAGDDPETASQIWTSPRYNDAALKFTSAVNSSLLFDAGYSFNYEEYVITNQDGINQVPFSREWYAGASRRDQTLVTLRNGLANWGGRYPDRFNTQASVSYVTGSHNAKLGFQYNWGTYVNTREANADLQQVYTNGVPSSVTIYNTPLRYKDALLGDLGIYAQDTWTINRLTLNGGIRFETLKHEVSKQSSGARPLHRRAQLRSDSDADLEGHRAAVRRGLRPVRQCQDRREVRPEPLQRIAHHVLRQPLQPAGAVVAPRSAGPTSTATTSRRASWAART